MKYICKLNKNIKKPLRWFLAFIIIGLLVVTGLPLSGVHAAVEDFTTFTESDPQSVITVTSTKVSWANLDRDSSSRVFKDMGVGYFGNFEHQLTISASASTYDGGALGHWMVCNSATGTRLTYPNLLISVTYTPTTWRIYLIERDDANQSQNDYTATIDYATSTVKYLTITRSGTDVNCYIYNDSGRTSLFDTLTLADCTTTTFRYVYVLAPAESSGDQNNTGYTENLQLQEDATATPSVTTYAASSITETSANLSGTVNSCTDNISDWGFQLGTSSGVYTDNYTYNGNVAAPFSFYYNGFSLTPSEHYFFRAFAISGSEIGYGDEDDFYAVEGYPVTVGTITSCIPTCECIGLVCTYTGDEDNDATCIFQASTDQVNWVNSPPAHMNRSGHKAQGSMFWLDEGTYYYIRAVFSDESGVNGDYPTTTTTTLDSDPALGTVHTYHVAKTGNDTTGVGSLANPWLTIQKAANTVVAGDTVYVHAGTYSEMVTITADGNSSNWITFMPYGDDVVTLDGTTGTRSNLFYLNSSHYVRIKGFNIQYSYNDSAILVNECNHTIIEDNDILGPGLTAGDSLDGGIDIHGGTYCICQNNTIEITTCTQSYIEGIVLQDANLGGHVVRNNTIGGDFYYLRDGISCSPEDSDGISECDIYDNYVEDCYDDDIQLDGNGRNVRCWGNICNTNPNLTDEDCGWAYASLSSISTQDSNDGPEYIFRNQCSRRVKMGGVSGGLYFYHNTFWSFPFIVQLNSGSTMADLVTRNNLVLNYKYSYVFYQSGPVSNCDCDYDNWSANNTPSYLVKWISPTYATLASFQSATGQMTHGLSDNDHQFYDAAGGNFTLTAGSVDIDKGIELPGFNDANSPWPYRGNAPDLGAYEYDSGGPYAPTIETVEATNISDTSARIRASVTSTGGENVSVIFHKGESDGGTTPASWSSNATAGYPTQPQGTGAAYLDLTELSPDTTYFFNVTANNSAGWDWGSTANFTTLASVVAPTLSTYEATSVTATTARISGVLSDDGGEQCTITGHYGESDEGEVAASWSNNSTVDSPSQPQWAGTFYLDLDGLTGETQYFYIFSGINSDGTSWSTTGNFTTLSISIPDAPTNVSAEQGTSTANVTISWDASVGASGYILFKNDAYYADTGNVTSYVDVDATPAVIVPGVTTASDGSSTNNVSLTLLGYYIYEVTTQYSLKAYNESGNSTISEYSIGWRGYDTPSYQWMVSNSDADSGYNNIAGAITENFTYADAPTGNITAGIALASDNTSTSHITLSVVGESTDNGEGRYYKCTITADGATTQNSTANRGYIGVGTLNYQWYRSSADSDADYAILAGATTDPYNDTTAPNDGTGRWYFAVLSADGADSDNTTANRGIRGIETPAAVINVADILLNLVPVIVAGLILIVFIRSGMKLTPQVIGFLVGSLVVFYIVKWLIEWVTS